jgi:hypothetical protein
MACTALVAIPNAYGNSASSDSPQQGEHYVNAQQTRPNSFSIYPNLTLLMCHNSGDALKNKGLSEGALSITLSSWRKSTQRQYIPYLNKWRRYCRSRQLDSLFSTCRRKVNFLALLYDEGIGYTGCIKIIEQI